MRYLTTIILLLSLTFFGTDVRADELLGITTSGEVCLAAGTGCTDAGKLVQIDPYTGNTTRIIGDTGIMDFTAMAYDPRTGRLIAAASFSKLYEIDMATADATRIVSSFLPDPDPPAGVIIAGALRTLSGMDFDPVSGDLFAIVNDTLTYFLVKLDLNNIDSLKRLEIEIIGVVGTTNYAYSGAPLGLTGLPVIAFHPTTGDLYGSGMDAAESSPHPKVFQIQTTPGSVPLATPLYVQAEVVRSFPRSMAFHLTSPFYPYLTGLREVSTGLFENVIFYFQLRDNGKDWGIRPLTLDAQVTGMAFVTELPVEPGEPPEVDSFYPGGGNAGILVNITGKGFTKDGTPDVVSVKFGPPGSEVDAPGVPIVLSDTLLRIVAPKAPTGPITVVNSQGSASSTDSFIHSNLTVLERDICQGIPSHPTVAGKDTVVRVFTASSASSETTPIPVTYGLAELRIIKPNGDETVIPSSYATKVFSNALDSLEHSHRHGINFYIDGEELDNPGIYGFHITIYGYDPDGQGPLLQNLLTVKDIVDPSCDYTTLVVLGGIRQGGQFIGPDQSSMDSLLKTFDEFSRTYPVRNGVSRLGQDLTAGVRFEVASSALVLGDSSGFMDVTSEVLETANASVAPLLDEYNENNSEQVHMSMMLFGDELFKSGSISVGRGYRPGLFSVSALTDFDIRSTIPIHEVGHNHGLVDNNSPNSDGGGHTVNILFPPGASGADVRAFNLPGRWALLGRPLSIMAGMQDGFDFFEDAEYHDIISPPAVRLAACSASSTFHARLRMLSVSKFFTLILTVDDVTASIIHSYASDARKIPTENDPDSPYSLVFLDPLGVALEQHPFRVNFVSAASNGIVSTGSRSEVITLVKSLPNDAAVIQIRKDDNVIEQIEPSISVPEVEIVYPEGGETIGANENVTVRWNASDADSDQLRFNVSYSPDGIRWSPVAAVVEGNSATWYSQYSGGSNTGRIRVTASDGFNTSQAESSPFIVVPKSPLLTIMRPLNGQTFIQSDSIVLEAIAYDMESGVLDGPTMIWSSNNDGVLGTGRKVVLQPDTLSIGTHVVTVQATDNDSIIAGSNNSVVTRDVTITVLADSDRDGLSDDFENSYDSQDPDDPYDAGRDEDGDGLTSMQESFFGTDPENPDSDGDGVPDGQEVEEGIGPNSSPPVIDPISDRIVQEGETLTICISASDPDGDQLFYTVSGLPGGASFDPLAQTLRYTPDFDVSTKAENTSFEVVFTVGDIQGDSAHETVLVTVVDVPLPRVYSFSLHVGYTLPLGNFNNNYDSDYSSSVDIDYHITPQLSLVGLFGYNRFKSGSPAVSDTYWLNLSANLKYEFSSNILRPYVNGGVGYYIPKSGGSGIGANLGFGFDYEFNPSLIFELGANYHVVFEENIQFSVRFAGVIFRF